MDDVRKQYMADTCANTRRVVICAGTGCVASGSLKVHEAFVKYIAEAGLPFVTELNGEGRAEGGGGNEKIHVSKSGCQGFCQMGPLVTIEPDGILYTKVKAEDVPEIVETSLVGNGIVERLLYLNPNDERRSKGPDGIPFYKRQKRTVLKECGLIDPEDIREYISHGGYSQAQRAWREMSHEEVCEFRFSSRGCGDAAAAGFRPGRNGSLRSCSRAKRNM